MDYAKLNNTILPSVMRAISLINNPEVDPTVRQLNQEILLRQVGEAVYAKVYEMNAFDMQIEHTTGPGIDDRYYGLAKVASGSISTGSLGLHEYVQNYLNTMTSKAQGDAMRTAIQSGQHPTLTRRIVKETCDWCKSMAGVHVNPSPDMFKRHGGCDCELITEGYRARNGLLGNYAKTKSR